MVHNFNAGPSVLPPEVFKAASEAILNFNNMGLSILEIGHRTDAFQAVMDEARSLVKELMHLNEEKEVLFLHGGASTQFFQVPMNLLAANHTAAYLDGGTWGVKAIKDARLYGKVEVVASSKDRNYSYIPDSYTISPDASYFHYTTNNTVEGTQMHNIPATNIPLVADMSSDILSQEMDFNRFSLIYAGAQKNIGAAGVNLVIVDPAILGKADRELPVMMDYREHIKNGSMLNTPPVFAVYVCMLTLRWLKQQGGVAAIQAINEKKAQLLYNTIDQHPIYTAPVAKKDRSTMNAVFTIQDSAVEKEFQAACKEHNFYGVKGHRSVGGFRISMYNALSYESVVTLTDFMKDFATKKG
ncbi:3-phosphoserine/phosphohydroxythreonine transaminase [Flavihumibacter sp. CACIAM 22H1]|uniref:3-phosphoserine/phosphohydroxythreonine transaminase n=1 Tax=Flavihumibacter sp. CACIAM 22H1 TaxID=1812911 RepID=UPI0007A7EB48|nr:3-phosphoserine/phosphohydroxythreonine transaminase [Flavihumibacter sp. CACIAM 22H1]KYP16317.1 MAG: 3-phosphoserine/phosphohydroxythreonine aminotransferase [Flavihumibacter sp. CACIAM 22H1]